MLLMLAAPGGESPASAAAGAGRRRRRRPGTALRLHRVGAVHASRTACPTTTSSPSRSTAPGSGSAPRTAWPASTSEPARSARWTEEDGLPWRVVSALDVNPKTGEVWLGSVRRRPGALQRRPLRPLPPAQQRPGQRRRLRRRRRERQRLGRHHRRGQPLQHDDRRVDDLHREERPDGGDLELRRAATTTARSTSASGAAASSSSTSPPRRWKDYLDPDGEMEIDLYRDDGIVHVITTGVELRRRHPLGVDLLRRLALRRPSLARATSRRTAALPSDFINAIKARSANEAWFCHRQGTRRGGRLPDRHLGHLHHRPPRAAPARRWSPAAARSSRRSR